MIFRFLQIAGFLGLLALVAGCFSFESATIQAGSIGALRIRASGGEPAEHVVISNNGWYLFNAIPLASGNAREDATFPWRLFSNHVTTDILHDRLTRAAAKKHCDVEELNVFYNEEIFLSIPGTSLPVPIPYILTFREAQISSVFVKRPEPKPAGGAE